MWFSEFMKAITQIAESGLNPTLTGCDSLREMEDLVGIANLVS